MIFSATLSLGLSSFFLGAAFGSLFCVLFAKILKKSHKPYRFSVSCVCASIFVVFIAGFLIFVQKENSFKTIISDVDNICFLGFYFCLGCVICIFWKILLLPSVILYFLMMCHIRGFLSEKFDSYPEKFTITLNNQNSECSIKIYKINPKYLFPVKRFYYELVYNDENIKENSDKIVEENKGFISKKIAEFDELLFKDVEIQKLDFPQARVYPALYLLEFKSELNDFDISISKTL